MILKGEGGESVHRIGGVLFGVLCIGMFGSLLVACNGRQKLDESSLQQVPQFIETEDSTEERMNVTELIALAEDEIELSSFSDGIAVYTTDKDPQELMELGDNNGYPALTVNSNHYQLKKISEVTDTNQ